MLPPIQRIPSKYLKVPVAKQVMVSQVMPILNRTTLSVYDLKKKTVTVPHGFKTVSGLLVYLFLPDLILSPLKNSLDFL